MPVVNGSASSIQTFTGIFFDPFDPDPADVLIEDIAHALSLQCRFAGHVKRHWSVAQHSILVAELCSDKFKLEALLHDAAEAYVVDMPRPIKKHPAFAFYLELEQKVDAAIAERFSLTLPMAREVTRCDNLALWAEADVLKHGTDHWIEDRPKIYQSAAIQGLTLDERIRKSIFGQFPGEVEAQFLSLFRKYSDAR